MKLLTFVHPELRQPRLGVLLESHKRVLDVARAASILEGSSPAWFSSLLAWLQGGPAAGEHLQSLLALAMEQQPAKALLESDGLQWLAPVPHPPSLRDCMSFHRHVRQAAQTVVRWRSPALAWMDRTAKILVGRGLLGVPAVMRERPVYYKGNVHSVIGHKAEVAWPRATKRLDFELEFGVYIGRCGRDIPVDRAEQYVGGYTIFNDFSARDVQLSEMSARLGPSKGKDFDTGNAMGPYLVTPEEVPDPQRLRMIARVNGSVWTEAVSSEMAFSIAEVISFISQDESLYPGDFIGLGTAPGGCGLELDRWIQPGDTVELDVEHLGVLSNRVGPRPIDGNTTNRGASRGDNR